MYGFGSLIEENIARDLLYFNVPWWVCPIDTICINDIDFGKRARSQEEIFRTKVLAI